MGVCVCVCVGVCVCVCVHLCEEIHPIQCLVWSENHPLDKFGFGVKTRENGKNTQTRPGSSDDLRQELLALSPTPAVQ